MCSSKRIRILYQNCFRYWDFRKILYLMAFFKPIPSFFITRTRNTQSIPTTKGQRVELRFSRKSTSFYWNFVHSFSTVCPVQYVQQRKFQYSLIDLSPLRWQILDGLQYALHVANLGHAKFFQIPPGQREQLSASDVVLDETVYVLRQL